MNSQLHDAFEKLMNEYATVFKDVSANNDWKNPFRDLISEEIPQLLRKSTSISAPYKSVGSYGKGRWTAVPWIAVFDTRITDSAQKGAYIVYLLNKETKELYLSFAFAATEELAPQIGSDGKKKFVGVVGNNNKKTAEKLKEKVSKFRREIPNTYFSSDSKIYKGTFLCYKVCSLPAGGKGAAPTEINASCGRRALRVGPFYTLCVSG